MSVKLGLGSREFEVWVLVLFLGGVNVSLRR